MMREALVKLLATGLGVGYLPKAPGTAGAVLGIGFWWLLLPVPWLLPGFILLAVWVGGAAARSFKEPDPACVVIDEIVGMPVALAGISEVWWHVLIGFAAFRLFDIWKPYPIRQLQCLPGGWGIVVDDLIAGVYASVLTHAVVWAVN